MGGDAPARFFVDENDLALGRSLSHARRDVLHPGHVRLPEVPFGTPDATGSRSSVGWAWSSSHATRRSGRVQQRQNSSSPPASAGSSSPAPATSAPGTHSRCSCVSGTLSNGTSRSTGPGHGSPRSRTRACVRCASAAQPTSASPEQPSPGATVQHRTPQRDTAPTKSIPSAARLELASRPSVA